MRFAGEETLDSNQNIPTSLGHVSSLCTFESVSLCIYDIKGIKCLPFDPNSLLFTGRVPVSISHYHDSYLGTIKILPSGHKRDDVVSSTPLVVTRKQRRSITPRVPNVKVRG